jgi:hypothetical protein
MNQRKDNISKAFGASMSFGFTENDKDYSLSKEDLVMKKYAGINIYQPTADNIERYIHKYVLNELAFFPQTLNVSIQFNPQEMDNAHSEYVSEGMGVVNIKYAGKVIQLPFMITDGELVPFDIIQVDGTRAPYSRENMQKVLYGLKNLLEKQERETTEDPYVGLSDRMSPATSPGFLGSVLQIRDQATATGGGHHDNYIYASAMMEEVLEKIASMKGLTKDDLKALELEFQKKAHEEIKAEYEKLAATELDGTNLKLFEKMKDIKFENAFSLPNGTAVAFPEKDGNEISMTYGIVVDNFMSFADKLPKKVKILITQDARIKILSGSESFLCLKTNIRFAIKQETLSTLQDGDLFMAFDGDKALFPCKVDWISEREYGPVTVGGFDPEKYISKQYTIIPVCDNSEMANLLTSKEHQNLLDTHIRIKMQTLTGAKFSEMPYATFIEEKAKDMGIDEFKASNLFSKESICISYNKVGDREKNEYYIPPTKTNVVFATDPETRVILIKGVVSDQIKSKDDLDKLAYVEHDEDTFEKTAAVEKNKIKVSLRDKQLGAYDVEVNYVDETKPVFKRFVKTYQRISKDDLRQLLLIIGYNNMEAQEIIFKAGNGPFVTYALPKNPNIQGLQGAKTRSLAQTKMQNTLKSMVKPQDLAGTLASSILGVMLADGLHSAPDKAKDIAGAISTFASDGKSLSSIFEKIALEKESESAFEVAKLMSLSSFFGEKVAEELDGKVAYPRLYDAAKDIMENRVALEKVAYNLMCVKALQYKNRNEIISPNYIQSAVNQLDSLHKVAYGVCAAKYDMSEVMEKEAKLDWTKFSPLRLGKIITKVSKKTGLPEGTIKGVLAGTAASTAIAGIGTGAALKKNELNKEASALAGALAGGLYGAGNAYGKAVDTAKQVDPYALPSDYDAEAGKKTLAGAAAGAAIGGMGGAAYTGIKNKLNAAKTAKNAKVGEAVKDVLKHAEEDSADIAKEAAPTIESIEQGKNIAMAITGNLQGEIQKKLKQHHKKACKKASEEIEELLKKAEMNVPTKEEAAKESNIALEPVKDIDCEVCGYKGQPDEQGYCPECGALGGVKPIPRNNAGEELQGSHDMGGEIYTESEHSFQE